MQEFSIMAKEAGICEATSDKVSNNADNEAFDKVGRFTSATYLRGYDILYAVAMIQHASRVIEIIESTS